MADLKNDIERYLRGEMTPEEMHRLEKEAIADPFLYEALEGGEMNREKFTDDTAELERRIARRTKRIWFTPLRIAASVVILAAAGWMVYWSVSETESATPLARTQGEPPAPAAADSLLKAKEDPKPDLLTLNAPKKESTTGRTAPGASAPSLKDDKTPQEDEALKEIVAPPVEIAAAEEKMSELPKADSVASAIGQAGPELSKKSAGSSDDAQQTRTAESRRSGAAATPASPAAKSKIVRDNDDSGAKPQGGIERYQEYLKTSLRYPAEAARKKTEGIVEVEFTVGQRGELSDFKVLKSLGDGCDEELIRLILNGPKWTLADATKGMARVRMAFKFEL